MPADSQDAIEMSTARDPDQADFDLERFIDMFDTALTSTDPRVVETLRRLLMIVALTRPEGQEEIGPLRRLYEDVHALNRKIDRLEEEMDRALRSAQRNWEQKAYQWEDYEKYSLAAQQAVSQTTDKDIINQLKAAARAKGLK